ncbi:unnamed protein product [Urochloa humidicola]
MPVIVEYKFLKAVPWKRLSEACEGYCLSEASEGYIKVQITSAAALPSPNPHRICALSAIRSRGWEGDGVSAAEEIGHGRCHQISGLEWRWGVGGGAQSSSWAPQAVVASPALPPSQSS